LEADQQVLILGTTELGAEIDEFYYGSLFSPPV
jgi:hypothetical protein